MFGLPIHGISILFLLLSAGISMGSYFLARAHLTRVSAYSPGKTQALLARLKRLPKADRAAALQKEAPPDSLEGRIAHEALQTDEAMRAAGVDEVLADVALGLEERSSWPRTAARIAGSSSVLLMALELALRLEVAVAIVLLLVGIASVIVCLSIDRRAASISTDVRRSIDSLVDVLGLRGPAEVRRNPSSVQSKPRRSRRR